MNLLKKSIGSLAMNDKIKITAWFDDRFYKVDDEFYPSVTTILNVAPKPFLAHWRGQVGNWEANRIMEEAMQKGSNVHLAINTILLGGQVVYEPKNEAKERELHLSNNSKTIFLQNQQEQLESYRFLQFLELVKPKIILTEAIVFNTQYKYAGTLDLLMEINKGEYMIAGSKPLKLEHGIYIADIKTGKQISNENYCQLSAYSMCLDTKVIGGLVLHTNASTTKGIEGFQTHLRTADELENDFDKFLTYLKIYNFNPVEPKVFDLPQVLLLKK